METFLLVVSLWRAKESNPLDYIKVRNAFNTDIYNSQFFLFSSLAYLVTMTTEWGGPGVDLLKVFCGL